MTKGERERKKRETRPLPIEISGYATVHGALKIQDENNVKMEIAKLLNK